MEEKQTGTDKQPRIRVSNIDTYTKLKALKGASGESITVLANKAMDIGVEVMYKSEYNKATRDFEANSGEILRLLKTINHGVNENLFVTNLLKIMLNAALNVLTDIAEGEHVSKENVEAGLYANPMKFIKNLEESALAKINKNSVKGEN